MAIRLNAKALKEKIKFNPHLVQRQILEGMSRITVVASAKRLGKSKLAAYLALKELFYPYHNVWIVGPNYELASRVWDYIEEWINKYFEGSNGPFRINKHDRIIENETTGAKLWMKTAENPESLLGKGLDLVIIDEAARIDQSIWYGYIYPNLGDKMGRAVLISNPFGLNWFYEEYLKGLPEKRVEDPTYVSFHFPTAIEDSKGNVIGTNNPHGAPVEELVRLKKTYPRDKWISEYLGVFQEGAGQVFKGVDKCVDPSIPIADPNEWFEPPRNGHLYTLGIDIAKLEDFTVLCVIDRMTHRLVGFWRINGVAWDVVREKVKEVSAAYFDAEIILDATGGAGDMFVENLAEIGVNVDTEFKYTNRTKILLMDKLSLILERGQIKFPRIPQLIHELNSFTYHLTDSGTLRYGSSRKDDCVNALALACWNLLDNPLGEDGFNSVGSVYGMKRRQYS